MAKLGDLHVGIIIDEAAFTAKMQKIKQILVNAERDINKVTGARTKVDLTAAKKQVELQRSQVALESAQLRLEEQKKKIAAGPAQKQEQDSRRALQQQYYQTASLSRLAFMIGGMTTAISLFGRTALTAYVTWEQKMADARAAAQATNQEFEEMVALSLSMGRTTIFSAIEAAAGMEILAKAGYRAADVIKALDGAFLLAGATGESFETGTALIVAVLSQFEMGAEKSTEAANILAGGAQFSLASIQSLGQGLKFVGPTLHMFGQGLDEGVTALAELQNAGIRAQMGGRLLATALMRLNSNSAAVQKGLSELGLTFSQVAPASNSLSTIIGNLEEAQKKLGNTQKFSAAMMQLFGMESVRVMIPLVALGKEGFEKLQSRINEAGTAEAMMLVRTDTLSFALKKLANVTKNTYIEFGKASAEGGIKGFVLGLTELLRKVEQTSPAFKSTIANMGGFTVASGIGITSVMGLIAAYATMRLAMVELAAATQATSLSFLSVLGTTRGFVGLLTIASLVSFGVVKAIQLMRDKTKEAAIEIAKQNLQLQENAQSASNLVTQYRDNQKALVDLKEGSSEYNDKAREQNRLIAQLAKLFPNYAEQVRAAKGDLEELEKIMKKVNEQADIQAEKLSGFAFYEKLDEITNKIAQKEKEIAEIRKRGAKALEGPVIFREEELGLYLEKKDVEKLHPGEPILAVREEDYAKLQQLNADIKVLYDELLAIQKSYLGETKKLPPPIPTLTEDEKAEIKKIDEELQREWEKITLDGFNFRRKEADRELADEVERINKSKKNLANKELAIGKARGNRVAKEKQIDHDEEVWRTNIVQKYKEQELKSAQEILDIKNQMALMGLQGKEKELKQLAMDEQKYYDQVAQLRLQDQISDDQANQLKTLIAETYAQQRIAVQKKLSEVDEQIARELVNQFEDIVQITEDWKLQLKSIGDIVKNIMNYIIKMMMRMALESLFPGLGLVTATPVRVVEGVLGKTVVPTPVQPMGGLGKIAIPNTAPMQALTQGPLPILTAAAKRSITFHYENHFEGTFLEPEKWFKEKFVPVQRRVAKQKLTGEGE